MTWISRWGYEVQHTSVPGIFAIRGGGYLLHGKVSDGRGRKTTVTKTVREMTMRQAQKERLVMLEQARERMRGGGTSRQTFSGFATSLFARKVASGELKSPKTIERWEDTLTLHLVPAFGSFAVDGIRKIDIEEWKARKIAPLIAAEKLSPITANGWLSILRVVLRTAVADLELERDATLNVRDFDTSEHHTYTEEDPNALTAKQAARFVAEMRDVYPQHYAMTVLGFATGLRPSTIRPIRRSGPKCDVLWDEGAILVRQSNPMRQSVIRTTKTKKLQRIPLPEELVQILREHAALLEHPPIGKWKKAPLWWSKKMADSSLLFPSRKGGYRTRSVLDKPFKDVSARIGLKFDLTPRGMRRTFQDLARLAEVKDIVTRAVSGHATERMQHHYSTVNATEVRAGIAKVVRLVHQTGTEG